MNDKDKNFLNDSDYNEQLKKLLSKFLKHKASIVQMPDGNIEIFETEIYQTVYEWNDKLKKIVIKSKRKLIE